MFGLRYHVASLAAVFVALAVGILLGVAVSGKVTDAGEGIELQNLKDDNENLQSELDAAREAEQAATERGRGAEELFERAYLTLMDGRLDGRNVAVVFLGPADGSVRADVEGALADAGAGAPTRVVALDVPVDSGELTAALEGDEVLAGYADDEGDFSDLGRDLGREMVEDGETLWTMLQSQLVEEQSGSAAAPIDAAVVVSTWQPPDAAGDEGSAAETEATASLLEGVVSGLNGAGIPVVGAAESEDPAAILEGYRDQGISSVDAVDDSAGKLALALLLAGAEPGHYGLRNDATDGVIPPIEPLSVEGE
jgi:Copper transport outer membrane protein, MctB